MKLLLKLLSPNLVSAILFAVAGCATAAPGSWSVVGPEGGRIVDLVADPVSPGHFYASTRAGVFRSTDSGLNWNDRSAGLTQGLGGVMAHSRTSPGTLFVLGLNRVFFSSDGGGNWQDRTPTLTGVTGFAFRDIEFAPSQPGRAYLARSVNVLHRTDDSGMSWSTVAPLPATFMPSGIAVHPSDADEVLVAGTDSTNNELRLFRTTDAGATWTETLCGGSCPWDGVLGLFTSDPVFAGFSGEVYLGLYKSTDSGVNWSPLPSSLGGNLSVNPSNSNEVYGAFGAGVCFTEDAGTSVQCDQNNFPANAIEIAASTSVLHNPFNPNMILAGTDTNGVYRRAAAPAPGNPAVWTRSDSGIEAQLVRAIAIAPGGSRIHASASDVFTPGMPVALSTDGAATWTYTDGPDAFHLRALTIDPNDSDVVYGGGVKRAGNAIGGGLTAANGGIYKTTDAGLTWSTIDNGIPLDDPVQPFFSLFGTVRDIELDPTSGSGPSGDGPVQTLYVGGTGSLQLVSGSTVVDAHRIYKSVDAGASWSPADTGIGPAEEVGGSTAFASVVQLIHSPADPTGQTLYAGTFLSFGQAGGVLPSIPNGVFVTTDGGGSWTQRSTGLPRIDGEPAASHQNVLSLALDPTDPSGQTLFASVNDPVGSFLGSIYKTIDGGLTWTFSGAGLADRDVRDLIVDPVTGDVYAAVVDPALSGDGGVFRSEDGGTSWTAVGPGFPAWGIALKLALDRSGPNPVLYAGTDRSVQAIEFLPDEDIDGVPDLVENGAPNGGDGNFNGVPDSAEPDVASLIQNTFPDGAPAREGDPVAYVTVAITNAVSGSCEVLERVESVPGSGPASLPAPTARGLPGGALRFRVPDCAEVELELTFEGLNLDSTANVLAYIPDGDDRYSWTSIPASIFADTVTLTLTDGGAGDVTPGGDGIILFQGGPTELAELFFRDGFETR